MFLRVLNIRAHHCMRLSRGSLTIREDSAIEPFKDRFNYRNNSLRIYVCLSRIHIKYTVEVVLDLSKSACLWVCPLDRASLFIVKLHTTLVSIIWYYMDISYPTSFFSLSLRGRNLQTTVTAPPAPPTMFFSLDISTTED